MPCPGCPVMAVLPHLSCIGRPVPAAPVLSKLLLSWLSCHSCPVLIVQYQLSCPVFSNRPVLSFLRWLFCCRCPVPTVSPAGLAHLSCSGSLAQHSYPPVFLSLLSRPCCHVLNFLSICPVTAVLSQPSCHSCPVTAVLSQLSCHSCPVLDP
jgi:hypothetical protein